MCRAQNNRTPAGLNVFTVIYSFLYISFPLRSSLNAVLKWRLWRCRYRQKLLLRRKEHLHGPTPSHVPLTTTNYSWKFGCTLQLRHTIINLDGWGDWKILNGTSKWTLTLWNWQGCYLAVSSRLPCFDVSHLRCIVGKTMEFPDQKKRK